MSWRALRELIAYEAGSDTAKRIEERARVELGGIRITIAKRRQINHVNINAVAPGNAKQAASLLGVHKSTVYRAMRRDRIIR